MLRIGGHHGIAALVGCGLEIGLGRSSSGCGVPDSERGPRVIHIGEGLIGGGNPVADGVLPKIGGAPIHEQIWATVDDLVDRLDQVLKIGDLFGRVDAVALLDLGLAEPDRLLEELGDLDPDLGVSVIGQMLLDHGELGHACAITSHSGSLQNV
jgi:hypothetical protein